MKFITTKSLVLFSTLFILILLCVKEGKKDEKMSDKNTKEEIYNPGKNWNLNWSDEFNDETINLNKWSFQVEKAGEFNDEWQRYTNSIKNGYIENNCLVIKANHESDTHGMNQYTSARLHTANKFSFKYGKITAKIKLPYSTGIWPAFWMLGANINENGGDTPWPQCGEIDILELYGSKDDAVIESNIHYANDLDKHEMLEAISYKLEKGKFADNFHIFELEWNEKELKMIVDGKEFASKDITEDKYSEFRKEFFILLNIAVGGTYAGRPDDTSVFPQMMYIDWIRVYKKTNILNQ